MNSIYDQIMKDAWRKYERHIVDHFRKVYPDACVEYNVRRVGVITNKLRQVDILVSGKIAGFQIEVALECKYFSKKVDVKDVEAFLGMLDDLRVSKGVMITNMGFSEAALARSTSSTKDIELVILEFEDLETFGGFQIGLAHRGECAVQFPCPTGWVAHREPLLPQFICVFSRPKINWDDAIRGKDCMYLDFSSKKEFPAIQGLLDYQTSRMDGCFRDHESSLIDKSDDPFVSKSGRKIYLRRINYAAFPQSELTAFVEFESFYFFVVLITDEINLERDTKKLLFIVKNAIPLEAPSAIENEN